MCVLEAYDREYSTARNFVEKYGFYPFGNDHLMRLLEMETICHGKKSLFPVFEEAGSSSRYIDPSNMHKFYQKYPSIENWTKSHPLEQVPGDPSKLVMTRSKLATDAEMCMYALT
ncbi:hypothetical protein Tco_1395883, partial [Tanacetum coccineum]